MPACPPANRPPSPANQTSGLDGYRQHRPCRICRRVACRETETQASKPLRAVASGAIYRYHKTDPARCLPRISPASESSQRTRIAGSNLSITIRSPLRHTATGFSTFYGNIQSCCPIIKHRFNYRATSKLSNKAALIFHNQHVGEIGIN